MRGVVLRAAVLVLFASVTGLAQGAPGAPGTADRGAVLTAARALMQKARYATLGSIGTDGHPQARIVDPFAPDEAFTVWIGTNARSRKVEQIEKDPRVTLLYFDTASEGEVTLLGTARIVRDAEAKARYWKEEWSSFFRDKNRGADYVLIRVSAARLEVSSPAHGILNDPATFRPVIVDLK